MSITITRSMHGLDTEDMSQEFGLEPRRYDYTVTASGGGKVKVRIEHRTPDIPGIGSENVRGKWKTLVDKFDTDSGQTTSGHFTLPSFPTHPLTKMRVHFSRSIGSKGVDYVYHQEP